MAWNVVQEIMDMITRIKRKQLSFICENKNPPFYPCSVHLYMHCVKTANKYHVVAYYDIVLVVLRISVLFYWYSIIIVKYIHVLSFTRIYKECRIRNESLFSNCVFSHFQKNPLFRLF